MYKNTFLEIKKTKEKNKITIPKKIIKKAVDRNKIKRRIKHILRSVGCPEKTNIKIKKDILKTPFSELKGIIGDILKKK